MNHTFRLAGTILACFILAASCRQSPVDAVYYGEWVNTYTEEYSYETQESNIILENEWLDKKWQHPPFLELMEGSKSFEIHWNRLGGKGKLIQGKWSIRNNNDLTIQTNEFLFSGSIVLLKDVLIIEGHQYPLDEYQRAKREEGIKRKLKYRRATNQERLRYHGS